MNTDDKITVNDIRNIIVMIKSDLYCEEWNDTIEEKIDLLDEIDDLLCAYLDIE